MSKPFAGSMDCYFAQAHAHAKHPRAREILTIPARRPIKPVYIRKLVRYIDAHGEGQ